jgi:acetyl esterase/lipase
MRLTVIRWGLMGASLLLLTTAGAQDKSKYYTVMHPDEFKINWKAFYDRADELTAAIRKELPHHLDLAYGEHPKQKLDLYLPAGKPSGAPIFIFLHGGGFREGDRAHYGYVARPFARHGIITVVASYRLTPEFRFPDQPEDVVGILRWVHGHIKDYGGDAKRIYLSGHSAGAILAATVGLDRGWLTRASLPADLIKGSVPVSGSYQLRVETGAPGYTDAARVAEASPIHNIDPSPPPALVVAGSLERHAGPSKELADKIREKGGRVELLILEGMDHDHTAAALGDERGKLVQAILKLIQGES